VIFSVGDFVVVGGRGTNRVTIHSYVEMDAIQEIEYGAVTASEEEMTNPAPSSDVYPIAIDLGPKETCLAIALSDQTGSRFSFFSFFSCDGFALTRL
jgi:hypothetical protein